MAQAIFKSWLVDFEPWGGVMPEDWREGTLGDILQSIKQPIKAGERLELPYVPIDAIPMNSLALTDFRPNEEAQSSLITFEKNDILIGAMRVYFHRVAIAPFDGITRTTCFILRPKKRAYLEYALLLCNEDNTIDYAQSTSKGSTMPYAVWDNGLADFPIAIPPIETIQEFSDALCPLVERLRDSLFEIRQLSCLRDTLLPRLMSGELSVADVGGRMVSAPTDGAALDGRQDADPTGEETPDGRMVSAPTGESGIVGADTIRPQTDVVAK